MGRAQTASACVTTKSQVAKKGVMSRHSLTLLTVLGAAAALAACGHSGRRHVDAAVAPGSAKANPAMDWTFSPQGSNASLVYGAPGGQSQLMMACTEHSGTVVVGQPISGEPKPPLELVLTSGTVKSSGAAQVQAAPDNPNERVLSESFSTFDPIIQAFARNGWIAIPGEHDKVETLSSHSGNKAVSRFLAFCG